MNDEATNWDKILTPNVRKYHPNLVAEAIVGVQPMGETFTQFTEAELGGLSKDEVVQILKDARPELFV